MFNKLKCYFGMHTYNDCCEISVPNQKELLDPTTAGFWRWANYICIHCGHSIPLKDTLDQASIDKMDKQLLSAFDAFDDYLINRAVEQKPDEQRLH